MSTEVDFVTCVVSKIHVTYKYLVANMWFSSIKRGWCTACGLKQPEIVW